MALRAWLESGKRPPAATLTSPSPSKEPKCDAPAETSVQTPFKKNSAEALLELEDFKDQALLVRNEGIYCLACKTEVGCERRLLRQHCLGRCARRV
jgi:hypothetical protein